MVSCKSRISSTVIVCLSTAFLLAGITSCMDVSTYQLENGELFPGDKLVGQPYTSKRTDIRMVKVSSVQEADSFFVALCRNSKYEPIFTYCQPNGRKMLYYQNNMTNGEMLYTHEVPEGSYEVGIIYIQDYVINKRGVREVHFVETIKPKIK